MGASSPTVISEGERLKYLKQRSSEHAYRVMRSSRLGLRVKDSSSKHHAAVRCERDGIEADPRTHDAILSRLWWP